MFNVVEKITVSVFALCAYCCGEYVHIFLCVCVHVCACAGLDSRMDIADYHKLIH